MNGNRVINSHSTVSGSFGTIKNYLEMFKIHLCIYIGFSASFGHVMASGYFSIKSLFFGFFVFALSCGSAVLNNIQDREYDSFFLRTFNRSLPQNKIPLFNAKIIAILMIAFGLSGLLFADNVLPFFFGIIAVICYNAIYTPLKKKSLMALVPGSISGMIAPLIGWSATGKPIIDPDILIILSVFGLWQIPHFFIIVLKTMKYQHNNPQFNKFPCFTKVFSSNELILQTLIWTSLYSLAILLFLITGSIKNQILSIICGLNAVWITFFISTIIYKNKRQNYSFAFAAINLSILLFMGAGIWDKFIL